MEHVGLDDYLVHGGWRLHDGYYLHQGEACEITSQLLDHVDCRVTSLGVNEVNNQTSIGMISTLFPKMEQLQ